MIDKGYDDPLYSFDLVRDGSLATAPRRWTIAVPQGLLVAPPQLRRGGMRVTTDRCAAAVQAGLAVHAPHAAAFAAYGLDQAWADHMRRWCARMIDQDRQRTAVRTHDQVASSSRQSLTDQVRLAWRRLVLSARLAGRAELVAAGPLPRARLQLIDALTQALDRADAHADALAQYGFSAAQRHELRLRLAELHQAHHSRQGSADQAQGHSDAVVVMRAALLGDLRLLVQVAPAVLPPREAAALRMGRLLPRRRGPAAADAASPQPGAAR